GGAAFPTGAKWEAVAGQPAHPHYLVCNADESEPGTFKDRILMECDPFALVEAMPIAAFATGCERGFVYVRAEYPLAHERLEHAFAQARSRGLLGEKVMDSGFDVDLELRIGAGAYVCVEETALFESIEGNRGEPRNKPPFPVAVALFGKPTVVNNVETLMNVPEILNGDARETRLFCLSGHVARPGLYEVELGTPLRTLLELAGSKPRKAVLLGGAAGSFVAPEQLDLALPFEDTRAAGATLCYAETLTPVNAGRVCVVELEGAGTLVPACSRTVEPGMVVHTDSERVRTSRRLVLELLGSSVDLSTAPAALEYIERYDAKPERLEGARVSAGLKIDNELYVRDYSKCILCYKCVEACGVDHQNTFAIHVAGRGFDAHISTEL